MLKSARHLLLAASILIAARPSIAADATTSAPHAETPQCWFGIAVENIPPAIAKQLKLQPHQGLMVMAIMPDSPAEKSVLKPDDLLIELNGIPLMSQLELANAANTLDAASHPCISHITYLHDGDRVTIDLTPAARPSNMLVFGGNLGNFIPQQRNPSKNGHDQISRFQSPSGQNYVLPNGSAAQVGPGYRMDLSGDGSSLTMKSIKAIVGRGQTIVLSQETDSSGTLRSTIAVGGKSYPVDAGSVDSLPSDLQPLALQLLQSTQTPVATTAPANSLEQRVKDLEAHNQELQQKLSDLIQLLKKEEPPAK